MMTTDAAKALHALPLMSVGVHEDTIRLALQILGRVQRKEVWIAPWEASDRMVDTAAMVTLAYRNGETKLWPASLDIYKAMRDSSEGEK